jgi:BirA family biotin operon repressor/biotin-[acetyl-CoA-carboxylase] ligase
VVLRPDAVRPDFAAIGLAVAVGLADALPVDVELKWPNDLLAGGRKLAGILCESRWVGGRPDVVVGFGLNVHQRAFEGELAEIATSLALCGVTTSRGELLARVLGSLEDVLDGFVQAGFPAIRATYEQRCAMLGRMVEVGGREGAVRGVAEGLDDDGALLLRPEAGGAVRRIEVADEVRT